MGYKVLIVDDEEKMRKVLELMTRKMGHEPRSYADPRIALKAIETGDGDIMITDVRMPQMSGLELLKAVKAADAHIPVIVMTAYGTVESAVEAMKAGALDYIMKPFDIEELEAVLTKAAGVRKLLDENTRLKDEIQARGAGSIISASDSMKRVVDLSKEVAVTRSNVLITGESGTGKELVARLVHDSSPRASGPFVAINCAAIPETLLESELFGVVKGAYTGAVQSRPGKIEQADGGTLFLDEIGDMPLPLQAKMLRAVQERTVERVGGTSSRSVDVRFISATNKDLQAEISARRFREDLFFRLNVIPVNIPPLRERREDIPVLARHFLSKYAAEIRKQVTGISDEAMAELSSHPWPGNVRELQNGGIELSDLPEEMRSRHAKSDLGHRLGEGETLPDVVMKLERDLIINALEKSGWVQVEAAKILGINERSLWHKVKKHNIRIKKGPAE
jgi:two-component system response regulator AtoC